MIGVEGFEGVADSLQVFEGGVAKILCGIPSKVLDHIFRPH